MSQPISWVQLALAAGLLLVSVALSWRLRLGLTRDILVSGTRMTVQLLLVGLILGWVFALRRPWPLLAIGLVMTALAAQAAAGRSGRRYAQQFLDSFVAIFGSSFLLTGVALWGLLRVQPWYQAQYAVPVLGMVLGNSLTGVALAQGRFLAELDTGRARIEGLLALGATRWEAAHAAVALSVRTGMVPTLSSMAVMGVVSLPGMMTGQILAGASPATAVRYQIVIMFVLATGSALGSLMVVLLAYRTVLDPQHRLRLDRLK